MREEISVRENGSKRVIFHFDDPSLTRQEFKDECDLGMIIRRFSKTHEGRQALKNAQGFMDNMRFEDVSAVPDFQTARNMINRGNEVFGQLPAALRKRFDNDAAQFLDFVHDPKNLDELRALGIAKPLVSPQGEQPVKPVDSGSSTPPVKG